MRYLLINSIRVLIVLIVFLLHLNCKKQDLTIIPISSLNYTTTINTGEKNILVKGQFYLVRGYDNSREANKEIESFAKKNKDRDFEKYDSYSMCFYKESSETTLQNILKNPKIIDRYSNLHDHVVDFKWDKGKFFSKFEYKDGMLIEPSTEDIHIDAAPPKDK